MSQNLTIAAWNMRSMTTAGPYVNQLISDNGADIVCLSEHRLYEYELHKIDDLCTNYCFHAKASADLKHHDQSKKHGHCGVAILWSKNIANNVRTLDCRSDRICIVEIIKAVQNRSLYVFSVYLPHQNCQISNFEEHLEILSEMIHT